MRAVVQRVSQASVSTDGRVCGSIETGLLVYVGVERDDAESDVAYIADKVRHLRIFPDDANLMNLDVTQVRGKILIVSAFTVQADARRGRRPSFESAASNDHAYVLCEMLCQTLANKGLQIEKGSFGDKMQVLSTNAGPVCVLLESRRMF